MAKIQTGRPGLLLVQEGQQVMFPITEDRILIGRRNADIVLDDARVSGEHAEIVRSDGGFLLKDLGSTNGTFVNRVKIEQIELVDQDVIEIGMTSFCFFARASDYHGSGIQKDTHATKSQLYRRSDPGSSDHLTTSTRTLPIGKIKLSLKKGRSDQENYEFRKAYVVLGRSDVDLPVIDSDVSRHHAVIETLSPRIVYLRDLGSTNGTYVNGQKIENKRLESGDEIQIGSTIFKFHLEH